MHQFKIMVGPMIIQPGPDGFVVELHPVINQALDTMPNHRGTIDDIVRNLKVTLDVQCPNGGPELATMVATDSLLTDQALNRPFKVLTAFFGVQI